MSDNARYTMAQLLCQAIDSGAPPSLARIPMTPEEVAASYDEVEDDCEVIPDWHDGPVRWRSQSRLGGNTRRRRELADALEVAGFWADLPDQNAWLLRAEMVAGKPPLMWLGERGWIADGEDLAEGGVEELLGSMTDALRRYGVSPVIETAGQPGYDDAGYAVRINGRLLDLIDVNPADPRMPLAEDPWMDCTVKPLGIVNDLLE